MEPMQSLLDGLEVESEHEGDRCKVTLYTTQEAMGRVVQLLQMLMSVSSDIQRSVRATERQVRVEQVVQQQHASRVALVNMYWALRQQGVKHRRALDQVAQSPLAVQTRYRKTDIGWAVRAYNTQMEEV